MENNKKRVIVYGSKYCGPCQQLKERLNEAQIKYVYADITENLSNLKVFLKYRDTLEMFDEVKEVGAIGIPFVVVNKDEKFYLEMTDEDLEGLK